MDAETFNFGIGEQHVFVTSLRLTQPGSQHGECGSSDRCTTFLAPFTNKPRVDAGAKDDILTFEPGHLG